MSLLSVKDLSVSFKIYSERGWFGFDKRKTILPVNSVSFDLAPGEILGIVGESGCGKTTLMRAILGRVPICSGTVLWNGTPLIQYGIQQRAREIQMIFQDPLSALDPRMNASAIIGSPLKTLFAKTMSSEEIQQRIYEVMDQVGLPRKFSAYYPHQFSGGQAQRVAIARALVVRPKMLICDEPVAALDVSIQGQILNLLLDLREELNLSVLFVAHDLSVVRQIADHILVFYMGKIVESGTVSAVYDQPLHPYTEGLLACVPKMDPDIEQFVQPVVEGDVPSLAHLDEGCSFRPRCPYAIRVCRQKVPICSRQPKHVAACHLVEERMLQAEQVAQGVLIEELEL